MDPTILWQSVLASLEQKISKASIATWFSSTTIKKKEEDEIVLAVPNIFVKEWLENKFESELLSTIKEISPDVKKIKYVISNQKPKENLKKQSNPKLPVDFSQPKIDFYQNRISGLNPKYTLKNFVVGSFNQLAAACAVSVIKKWSVSSLLPKEISYNPLFIYSGVGLGKTHLLEAVGNEIINARKKRKVKYIACSNFTSQVIAAIRDQSIERLVKEYQTLTY